MTNSGKYLGGQRSVLGGCKGTVWIDVHSLEEKGQVYPQTFRALPWLLEEALVLLIYFLERLFPNIRKCES